MVALLKNKRVILIVVAALLAVGGLWVPGLDSFAQVLLNTLASP